MVVHTQRKSASGNLLKQNQTILHSGCKMEEQCLQAPNWTKRCDSSWLLHGVSHVVRCSQTQPKTEDAQTCNASHPCPPEKPTKTWCIQLLLLHPPWKMGWQQQDLFVATSHPCQRMNGERDSSCAWDSYFQGSWWNILTLPLDNKKY